MRGRRRYRAPRRPRIPPSASIAPVAQHRGGNAQLACDLAQRPTAAHQQSYRFLLELIRKMTPSLAPFDTFPLPPELSKGVHQFEGASCWHHNVAPGQPQATDVVRPVEMGFGVIERRLRRRSSLD